MGAIILTKIETQESVCVHVAYYVSECMEMIIEMCKTV